MLRRFAVGALLVAVGSGVTAGVFLWSPWDSGGGKDAAAPASTPDRPKLTSEEVVGLVVAQYKSFYVGLTSLAISIARKATAPYQGDGKWQVTYTPAKITFHSRRSSDGHWESLRPSLLRSPWRSLSRQCITRVAHCSRGRSSETSSLRIWSNDLR